MSTSDAGTRSLRTVSLFSGIGGIDLGMLKSGHTIVEMCESWTPAQKVLERRFPGIPVADDVRTYTPALAYDLLTAGFPCVDISHAGSQRGIFGPQSGLVEHVFRILHETTPEWVVLENVPNILRLQKGAGIAYIIDSLVEAGYKWAYRVVDSRASGVPQRRNRVIVLASRNHDPAPYLLADEAPDIATDDTDDAWGFYWTEGRRGVGLVKGAVPTLKGGSTVGAPSAPAIWNPTAPVGRRIALPSIEDAEELQGFERGWTEPAEADMPSKHRWKLVGNAVTVGISEWLGGSLAERGKIWTPQAARALDRSRPWPDVAWGEGSELWSADVSRVPVLTPLKRLADVVDPTAATPLSHRATAGFMSRLEESGITLDADFVRDLELHLAKMRKPLGRTARPEDTASWASSPEVRRRMQKVKGKNTKPEVALRRELTDMGLRYRIQHRPEADMRWRSDIVFLGKRVVVDIRGCYWHACPLHSTLPKVNAARWLTKLEGNRARDDRMVEELSGRGWTVVVVWEHEDPHEAAVRVADTLASRPTQRTKTAAQR